MVIKYMPMKRLVLIRHAESGYTAFPQKDIDRELTEDGKTDAESMSGKLEAAGIVIDYYVSSGAKRTAQTIAYFNKANQDVVVENQLFHASEADFFDTVLHLPSSANTVAICAHNPGISRFVDSIIDQPFSNMPPGGVCVIEVKADDWLEFATSEKVMKHYFYPVS